MHNELKDVVVGLVTVAFIAVAFYLLYTFSLARTIMVCLALLFLAYVVISGLGGFIRMLLFNYKGGK